MVLPVLLAGVCDPGDIELVPRLEDQFSFEVGLEGWSVIAAELGTPPNVWSVETSQEYAVVGVSALKLTLENNSGQSKLIVRRPFDLDPNTDYEIDVSFQLASADADDGNPWTVLAGATAIDAVGAAGLTGIDGTENGRETGAEVVWSPKGATFSVRTGPNSGRVWIAVGVGATTQSARSYWIDELRVTARLP